MIVWWHSLLLTWVTSIVSWVWAWHCGFKAAKGRWWSRNDG